MENKISKYKSPQVKAHSWSDIESHYLNLNEKGWHHEKLLELVKYIIQTRLCDKLFAYTSLDNLHISIYENIQPKIEELHVGFDRDKQEWSFKYYAEPRSPEFTRIYKANEGINKFENFINMIKW
jgi:hypothetical protein